VIKNPRRDILLQRLMMVFRKSSLVTSKCVMLFIRRALLENTMKEIRKKIADTREETKIVEFKIS
jgi:hypothetical protein